MIENPNPNISYFATTNGRPSHRTFGIKVATDRWMREVGLENFRRLDDVRDRHLDHADLSIVLQEILNAKRLTLASIFERAESKGISRSLVMPIVLKLVHQRDIGFDVRQPLTMETVFDDQALAPTFR